MTDGFTNTPLAVEEIPQLADEDFTGVDHRYLRIRIAQIAFLAFTVTVAATVVAATAPRPWVTLTAAAAALTMLVALGALVVAAFRRLGYQLRARDVSLRSGLITRRVETIPFTRVQHVTVHRGPLERLAGLATLEVSSAGPDLAIPGLAVDDAARIKQLITERAGVDETTAEPAATDLAPPAPPAPAPPDPT